MMKKMLSLALALLLCLSLAACGGTGNGTDNTAGNNQNTAGQNDSQNTDASDGEEAGESDLQYIKDKGTLVVGMTNFAPMDYKDDNGEWIGFDADMARIVADKLGVDIEFVEIDWDNKIMELDSKNIDVVWNGMTLTDEVKAAMECSVPYCNNAQVVVVAK